MSSSRILSSRPSASCITAKPIARTIRGRGRNASPFFAAQKLGKPSRLFHQRMPGALLCGSLTWKPHSPPLGHCGGHGYFRTAPPEVGKPSGLFRQSRRSYLLYGSLPWKPHSPLLVRCGGTGRFRTGPPEVGKPRGLFRQGPSEALALWLSVPETAQPIAGALWGRRRFRITQPEAGKPSGLFHQGPPRALLYGSLSRNPHSPPLGHWAFPHRPAGSGEAERAFPSAHAEDTAL